MFNWSYLLDVLSEINKLENLEENKEVLENLYYNLLENTSLPKVDLFLGVVNQPNRPDSFDVIVRAFQRQYLNLQLFNETIARAFDLNLSEQMELLVNVFNIPKRWLKLSWRRRYI